MDTLHPLQVSLFDVFGGADRVALDLHHLYLSADIPATLFVSNQRQHYPGVELLPHEQYRSAWARMIRKQDRDDPPPVSRWRASVAEPLRTARAWLGYADYDWPGSRRILEVAARTPQPVVHLHAPTVRFDLRLLPDLSQRFPTVITLHDMMAFTGWCLHANDCEKWRAHCGSCPQLTGEARVSHVTPRDKTRANLEQKRRIYARSSLYLAAPSQWLADKAADSILAPAIRDLRVIPNGVDTNLFAPVSAPEKAHLRAALNLPPDAIIIALTAVGKKHPFKDSAGATAAIEHLADSMPEQTFVLLLIGEMDASTPKSPNLNVVSTGFLEHHEAVAHYLQATDIYLHCAFADTFPLSPIEAQLCGLPVIATDVGGIPETLIDNVTGFLVTPRDDEATAARLQQLVAESERRHSMGAVGRKFAAEHLSVEVMAQRYLAYYEEAADACKKGRN